MKFCNQCGAQLEDAMLFCNQCGAKQEVFPAADEVPEAAPVTEAPLEAPVNAPESAPVTPAEAPVNAVEPEPVTPAEAPVYMAETVPVTPAEPVYAAPQQPDAAYGFAGAGMPAGGAPAKPKKSKKGLIIGLVSTLVVVAAAVVGVILFLGMKKETVDASKLVKVIAYGPNGYGSALAMVADESKIRNLMNSDDNEELYPGMWVFLYEKAEADTENYPDGFPDWIKQCASEYFKGDSAFKTLKNEDKIDEAKDALKKIKVEIEDDEKNGRYSVGDKIKVKVKADEEELKKAHVVLTNTSFEYTFTDDDFAPVTKVDPFENFTVTFTGYDGKPEIKYDFEVIPATVRDLFYYSVGSDFYDAKKNGDTITFTANPYGDITKGYLTRNGKYYSVSEADLKKVVTVSGLQELQEIDVFEGIAFKYEGLNPSLSVSIDTSNMKEVLQNNVTYRLDKSTKLRIGEQITVKATIYSSGRQALNEAGYTYDEEKLSFVYTIPATAPHILGLNEGGYQYDPAALFNFKAIVENQIGKSTLPGGVPAAGEIISVNDVRYTKKVLYVNQDEFNNNRNQLWQLVEADYTYRTAEGEANATAYVICKASDALMSEDGKIRMTSSTYDVTYCKTLEIAEGEFEKNKTVQGVSWQDFQ